MALSITAGRPVFGAAPIPAELVVNTQESIHEEVAVSGAVVVGVAAANADGVYFARNTYRIPKNAATPGSRVVLLPFEGTKRPDLIRGYGAGDLAVRTTPGKCEASSSTYLIAASELSSENVEVLINGFGANAVFYRTADGSEADCTEITEGRRTSYDYRCAIPIGSIGTGLQSVVNGLIAMMTIPRFTVGRQLDCAGIGR